MKPERKPLTPYEQVCRDERIVAGVVTLVLIFTVAVLTFVLFGCATTPALDPRDPGVLHERAPTSYPIPR